MNRRTKCKNFLRRNFGFRNSSTHQIVPGVIAFQIEKPVSSLRLDRPNCFSFAKFAQVFRYDAS